MYLAKNGQIHKFRHGDSKKLYFDLDELNANKVNVIIPDIFKNIIHDENGQIILKFYFGFGGLPDNDPCSTVKVGIEVASFGKEYFDAVSRSDIMKLFNDATFFNIEVNGTGTVYLSKHYYVKDLKSMLSKTMTYHSSL